MKLVPLYSLPNSFQVSKNHDDDTNIICVKGVRDTNEELQPIYQKQMRHQVHRSTICAKSEAFIPGSYVLGEQNFLPFPTKRNFKGQSEWPVYIKTQKGSK